MPNALCPTFLAEGNCSNTACNLVHSVLSCEVCGMILLDDNSYRGHMRSRKHIQRATASTRNRYHFCSLCTHYANNVNEWRQHVKSRKHVNKATKRGVSSNIEPEFPVDVPGQHFCALCRRHIPENLWARHIRSDQHKSRKKYAIFKSAMEEAEEDKNGVIVTGEFDFGVVEPSSALEGVSVMGRTEAGEPTCRFIFVECQLASSRSRAMYSPFQITLLGTDRTICAGAPLIFQVTMRSDYIGRCEDRLEMVFEDVQMKKRFMIARSLHVTIGSRADHELLKPKTPYVPRIRTGRPTVLSIVSGEPADLVIPYKGRLTLALIPEYLTELLETGTTRDIIQSLRSLYLPAVINSQTYSRHFKHLLWIEEVQMERDLERYAILDAKLTRHATENVVSDRPTNYYYLKVPGLAEKRPSVLVGDRILAQRPDGNVKIKAFEGVVHVVHKEEVGLRFHHSFSVSPSDRFHFRFRFNRIPMRRQHQALDSVFSEDRVLFPTGVHVPSTVPTVPANGAHGLILKNAFVGTNPPQLQAVLSIVRSAPGSLPFIIFGPPGTGKTVTMVEAILQVLDAKPSARILACAPSNSAADLIASRLRANNALSKKQLFRAYAPYRPKKDVPPELLDFTCVNSKGLFTVPSDADMKDYRVIVSTCVSASICSGIGMPRGHFSHIFIDEAGHATEPEAMVSIKGMADGRTNVVLSGDPKQLGPVIRSTIARQLGLEMSFIERLMGRDVYDEVAGYGRTVVKLVKNFRSHPAILRFPNERFYRGDLQACGSSKVINHFLALYPLVDKAKKFPIVFHSVSGKDDREGTSPSFFNIDEVIVVKTLIERLKANRRLRIADDDIGIIAPYHAQVLKIRTALKAIVDPVKLKVGSVEEFQGQERRAIVISTVRSSKEFVQYDLRHTLGFVANPRRFNVAVTRAQALLYIVGDPSVLSLDPLWRSFLNYVHVNGGWTGPGPTWDTSAPVDEAGGYDAAVRAAALEDMNEFTRRMESMTLDGVGDEDDADDADANLDRPWNEVE